MDVNFCEAASKEGWAPAE